MHMHCHMRDYINDHGPVQLFLVLSIQKLDLMASLKAFKKNAYALNYKS